MPLWIKTAGGPGAASLLLLYLVTEADEQPTRLALLASAIAAAVIAGLTAWLTTLHHAITIAKADVEMLRGEVAEQRDELASIASWAQWQDAGTQGVPPQRRHLHDISRTRT